MVQINDELFEDLNEIIFDEILNKLKNKSEIKSGSQIGRKSSEPIKL